MKLSDKYGLRIFSLLLCAMLYVCCIKEERGECPCRLIVDLAEVDSASISSVDIQLTCKDGFVHKEKRHADSYDEEDIISVPQEEIFLNVCYGDNGMMNPDGLLIPEDSDCPPVYLYSTLVDASDREFVRKVVKMRKNHCVMKIYVEGDGFPFDVTLKGNVCGYDASGCPVPGAFRYSPDEVGDSAYTVVLPRQLDSSLLLEVNDGSDVLKVFALGEYIKACGYDWTEDDLQDLTVGIDYARTQIVITVKGWDEVYEFDIVI